MKNPQQIFATNAGALLLLTCLIGMRGNHPAEKNYLPPHLAHPATAVFSATDYLFPIEVRNRWGFINQKGEVVIAPRFRSVGTYSEGLIPARLNGSWGYLDTRGEFVISPVFDYVEPFSEGLALVWKDARPFFIDKTGEKAFNTVFDDAGQFENGRCPVSVKTKEGVKSGWIDRQGHFILPAQFDHIHEPSEGRVILERFEENDSGNGSPFAVADTTGRLIVPFGRYHAISDFHNGFAEVSVSAKLPGWDSRTGFIDRNGRLAFWLPDYASIFESRFSEGKIAARFPDYDFSKVPDDCCDLINADDYAIVFDSTGKELWRNKQIEYVTGYRENRAFAGHIREWRLVDKAGNVIGRETFEWVNDFDGGIAIVATDEAEKYGAIDTNGRWVISPQFEKVADAGFQPEGLLVATLHPVQDEQKADPYTGQVYQWGLIDRQGNVLFPPVFSSVSPAGFQHGLLYAELDDRYGYVDRRGQWVWKEVREPAENGPIDTLNVDFMLRGYCYGYPADFSGSPYADGSVDQYNRSRPIPAELKLPESQFNVLVRPEEKALFGGQFAGMNAYIFNTGKDTVAIDVQDHRLYLVVQARDADGEWRDIEYSPASWCGNSYFELQLPPGEYWAFPLPVYGGDRETELRLTFRVKRTGKQINEIWEYEETVLYSNTFTGKINPAQFWRKQGYAPRGLMDPYVE